ncbi:MAG: hypothetical protein ACLR08_08540 [Dorea longicatena]
MMILEIMARSSILSVKLLFTKKDMACELEVKDMATRLGESFPMDLMAWNSFGW